MSNENDSLKKKLGVLLPSIIGTLITKTILKETPFLGVVGVFLVFLVSMYFLYDSYKDILIACNQVYSKRFPLTKTHDFFGRKDIVIEILQYHKEQKKLSYGIICGLGGSGKTALATNFGDMTKYVCHSYFVNRIDELPNVKTLKKHSIVFVDDAYAFAKNDDGNKAVRSFIDACGKSKKQISLWFLDRTSLVDFIVSSLELPQNCKRIDLNKKCDNNPEVLEQILRHRLKGDLRDNVKDYVGLIESRFDPKLCRPIWAEIIATILNDEPNSNFNNYENKEKLIDEYWKQLMNRKQFDAFVEETTNEKISQDKIKDYKNVLINLTESLILFSAITELSIIIDDAGEDREISFKKDDKPYENKSLGKCVDNCLYIGSKPIKRYLLLHLLPTCETIKDEKGIIIKTDTYDMISAWLLNIVIRRNDRIITELLKCVNKDLSDSILAFATRASEEDGGVILHWWIKKVYNPKDCILSDRYEEWIMQWCKLYPKLESHNLKEDMIMVVNKFASDMIADISKYNDFKEFTRILRIQFIYDNKCECAELIDRIDFTTVSEDEKIYRERGLV